MKYNLLIYYICLIVFTTSIFGQVYTDKLVGEKNAQRIDSLKTMEYPYLLPIWGQKVTNAGFELPYSAGLSVNYLWQESSLIINNLSIGFNNGPMYNIDQIVRFNNATATTNGINLRPDIWLFPFLNIYGIFVKSKTSTAVDFGLWLPTNIGNPDEPEWNEILSAKTKAEFDATTFGFGLTPTMGVGGGWIALDMNFTWTDIDVLEKPAYSFIFGPRIGKTFDLGNPEMNIAVWVGGFRVNISSETKGSLPLADLFPIEEWEEKILTASLRIDEAQQNVDNWWESLSDADQQKPSNVAKLNRANEVIGTASAVVDAASGAVEGAENSSVQYSLDKRQENMWNFLVGSQFQFNKNWMIRAEVGFLGTRTQFIGGIQYRFGL